MARTPNGSDTANDNETTNSDTTNKEEGHANEGMAKVQRIRT